VMPARYAAMTARSSEVRRMGKRGDHRCAAGKRQARVTCDAGGKHRAALIPCRWIRDGIRVAAFCRRAGLQSLCENADSEQPAAKAVLIAIDLRHG